ncbi:hypothetical protein BT67DRAFT_180729 [Trichocladium antarcticum]|uniref:Uncharacterized protein n=1 Tax=Trichocladium antarcticum TaxID=1450529 RepID=A0AAN6UPS6_9PEZI|nr:hypothetical protein BT67DRAFT_180729 [Trichocladium antarcticum]
MGPCKTGFRCRLHFPSTWNPGPPKQRHQQFGTSKPTHHVATGLLVHWPETGGVKRPSRSDTSTDSLHIHTDHMCCTFFDRSPKDRQRTVKPYRGRSLGSIKSMLGLGTGGFTMCQWARDKRVPCWVQFIHAPCRDAAYSVWMAALTRECGIAAQGRLQERSVHLRLHICGRRCNPLVCGWEL